MLNLTAFFNINETTSKDKTSWEGCRKKTTVYYNPEKKKISSFAKYHVSLIQCWDITEQLRAQH